SCTAPGPRALPASYCLTIVPSRRCSGELSRNASTPSPRRRPCAYPAGIVDDCQQYRRQSATPVGWRAQEVGPVRSIGAASGSTRGRRVELESDGACDPRTTIPGGRDRATDPDLGYLRLRQAIIDGQFHPNERLVEADLTSRFKLGRAAMRTALAR